MFFFLFPYKCICDPILYFLQTLTFLHARIKHDLVESSIRYKADLSTLTHNQQILVLYLFLGGGGSDLVEEDSLPFFNQHSGPFPKFLVFLLKAGRKMFGCEGLHWFSIRDPQTIIINTGWKKNKWFMVIRVNPLNTKRRLLYL